MDTSRQRPASAADSAGPAGTWGTADLHMHSTYSDGMATVRQIMEHVEAHTSLDVVAIADHDVIRGALEAYEWCAGRPGGRVAAVVATEISSAWGRHILGVFFAPPFPTRPFPRFASLRRTVGLIHDAGGLALLPHPTSALVPSVGERTFQRLLDEGAAGPSPAGPISGIEVCSGVLGGRLVETRLRRLNDTRWHVAELGSSDAHHLAQIGGAFTAFPGRTPAALRLAIESRTTQARWGSAVPISLSDHARQNWRSLVLKPIRELREVISGRA